MDYYWIPTKIGKILYFQILFQKYWYTTGFPQKFKNFISKILGYHWVPTKIQKFSISKILFQKYRDTTGFPQKFEILNVK